MFTTAAKVRPLAPTLLIDDDDLGTIDSGTSLTLTYPAFDVPTILIDGISSTAYTFKRPDEITLTDAATGQRFIAQTYIGLSDNDLEGLILTSDRYITAEFTGYDLPPAGYLEDWSGLLTASKYLRLYAFGTEENLDKAEVLEKHVTDQMKSFRSEVASEPSKILIKVNG